MADESNGDEVFAFMMRHFRIMEPITSSLMATEDDLEDFFTDLKDNGVMSGHSFLAQDGDKLVGICLNSVYEVRTSHSVSRNDFDPMKDYKDDIEMGSYRSVNANRIATFVAELDKDVKFAAPYAKRIFKIDVICVSPNYA
uniref:Uncharacterized protein n=1 Tax=Parascaris univalens TaxID=6257 RepID=A0A915APH4_PARUN